ncbi:protein RGF1 INDUCIBLE TRANSCRIPTION FACTOR 1-like isoform X2 [Curcuma longa]|uniref:protein RGF1 INDUCIBLE TRANSCRIPTION FACTOR 1-like isoform X2 n=1 Tax=Curcuma longa TaxID=136217 RepID=UPI003D9DB412
MIQVAVNPDSPFRELEIKSRGATVGGGGREEHRWPMWLRPLLSTSFFVQCKQHAAHSHRRECNMYCLDCTNGALCPLCVLAHRDHHAVQIRRSSYHDVIRVSEIQKVLDITGVQTYIINGARVVFLNERPQPRPGKGVARTCEVCYRNLVDSFRFCSLGCKLAGTSDNDDAKNKSREGSHSERSTSSEKSNIIESFPPSTPPPSKRRKGIPHRAPFGSIMLGF